MRHVSTFVSVAVLMWAVAATLRVPQLSWPVPVYLICQFGFSLVALWGLQKTAISHPSYVLFFNLSFFCVLVMALVCAGRFVSALPLELGVFVLLGCVALACAVGCVTYWRMILLYRGDVPYRAIPLVWHAAILLLAGSLSLISLLAETQPSLKVSALALGCFWLLLGVFFVAYSVGNIRLHTTFQRLNQFIPMMLAIVAFGWLAFQLGNQQREVARETVPQQVQVEAQ